MRHDLPIPPGHLGLGDAFDLAFARLEDATRIVRVADPTVQIAARLWGHDRAALVREEKARARVEALIRAALATGVLTAFCYSPNGGVWGQIPTRAGWSRRSDFPGLDTFLDSGEGPDVGGSPVFVERAAFMSWMAAASRKAGIRPGRKGRPSVMQLVLAEYGRRAEMGAFEGLPLVAVAHDLQAWFKQTHSDLPAPSPSTIEKHLRKSRSDGDAPKTNKK
ncbi:hypothetical protein BB934_22390 [Microvirga ossetica]|uniref:Uncharacterized protein n=1 Tax=Microvirga ossetica TaxID=1882682 RepID=A0A1B2EL10_9HYPH|nr:hypothetical protein [Microvirga ossetica]ANY80639.1 hypothetical protein BB934_22390 [Microvirga ossetica]